MSKCRTHPRVPWHALPVIARPVAIRPTVLSSFPPSPTNYHRLPSSCLPTAAEHHTADVHACTGPVCYAPSQLSTSTLVLMLQYLLSSPPPLPPSHMASSSSSSSSCAKLPAAAPSLTNALHPPITSYRRCPKKTKRARRQIRLPELTAALHHPHSTTMAYTGSVHSGRKVVPPT